MNEIFIESEENTIEQLEKELRMPGAHRLWYVADSFRYGMSITDIFNLTHIDPWFLAQIANLVEEENKIKKEGFASFTGNYLKQLKRMGFSDSRLAELANKSELEIRKLRIEKNIRPVFKRVDSCAAEFESTTAYMLSLIHI